MSTQSMQALARAKEIYSDRAKVKREIRSGERTIPDVLNLECCARMLLLDLLKSAPEFRKSGGRGTADQLALALIGEIGASPYCVVGRLSDRQRGLLSEACSGRQAM
jgi:hypothetical protein